MKPLTSDSAASPPAASAARAPIAAPRAPSAMAPGAGLSAGPALPLSFIGAGLCCLLLAAAWSAWQPELAQLPYPHPQVVGWIHLWLPGFLVTVCLGAVYQLMPVILGARIAGPRAAWWHLGLHVTGLAALVPGLATGRYLVAAVGGTLVVAGAVIAVVIVSRTFAASPRRDAIGACFPLAALWLLITVSAGLLAASNRQEAWLPVSVVALLGAHAHLGLAGFFVTLLQGATFQLVPMFTMGQLRHPRCVAAGLGLTQLGLPLLAGGLVGGHSAITFGGAALLLTGIGCSARALLGTLATRRRRRLETPLRAFCTGLGLLAGAAAWGVTTRLFGGGTWPALGDVTRYGLMLIPGALALAVMGMLLKIVPFLTWMHAYGRFVGRRSVPRATELSDPGLEQTWFGLHLAALALLFGGTFSEAPPWVARLGALLLLLAGLVFLANAARVLRHLRTATFIAAQP